MRNVPDKATEEAQGVLKAYRKAMRDAPAYEVGWPDPR